VLGKISRQRTFLEQTLHMYHSAPTIQYHFEFITFSCEFCYVHQVTSRSHGPNKMTVFLDVALCSLTKTD
jgi:hypothetical protein